MPSDLKMGKGMSKIPGRLLADLHPNGTVRIVVIATFGGGNEAPFIANDLDAAEIVFMTCGLTPECAAALRVELERNKIANVDVNIDDAVVAKFRYRKAVA